MQNDIKTEIEPQVCCDDWLERTLVATFYLVAGVGCVAFAINFRITGDILNCYLAFAGGICGCFAGIGVICAR